MEVRLGCVECWKENGMAISIRNLREPDIDNWSSIMYVALCQISQDQFESKNALSVSRSFHFGVVQSGNPGERQSSSNCQHRRLDQRENTVTIRGVRSTTSQSPGQLNDRISLPNSHPTTHKNSSSGPSVPVQRNRPMLVSWQSTVPVGRKKQLGPGVE